MPQNFDISLFFLECIFIKIWQLGYNAPLSQLFSWASLLITLAYPVMCKSTIIRLMTLPELDQPLENEQLGGINTWR